MREKIILAPGLNGKELIGSLALHGVNCIGVRVCGAAELARLALMRSGISIAEDFVSAREEAALTAEAVAGEPYFEKASFSDIREITAAIRRMRRLVTARDEEKVLREKLPSGIFREKNEALLHVCQRYLSILASRKAVDAVSLIRRAACESAAVDADFFTLKEYPPDPLEKTLLRRVSGGAVTETDLRELFGKESRPLRIGSIRECYGAPNEVESILADIYAGKPLDRCTVAVTDPLTYGQLFFDYALLYGIPVTFGCGIPIINSNPARLLTLYHRWTTGGFYGAAAIGALLSSPAFDREKLIERFPERDAEFRWSTFYEVLGNLRLTNDPAVNKARIAAFGKATEEELALVSGEDAKEYGNIRRKRSCIPCLEIMGRELGLPAEDFISRYACIRRGSDSNADRLLMMLDIAASRAIYDELKVIRGSGFAQSADDVIPDILKSAVCAQRSEPGRLHVTGIDGAVSSLREHLYLAGLSASKYPGSPKEDHLLLDADLKLFGADAEDFTSKGGILRKKERLLSLAKLAAALGTEVCVSYAGLNVSELKRDNASSLVFELFREACGENAATGELEARTVRVAYFEPAVSVSRLIGEAYTEGIAVTPAEGPEPPPAPAVSRDPDRAWSPTALETFFGCPRRFMLAYLLGIPEPEDCEPFVIMNAADTGTLAHSLMERLGGTGMGREAFLTLSGEYFERFLAQHPPLIPENVPAEKERFLEMMGSAYDMDPHREIELEEEDISCTHECGIRIHGFPDRVEKLEDGTCLVVDFKSGRKIVHAPDDIDSCLQVVLYAYLMERKGFRVSGGEYRYIRLGETVPCRYDEDMKRQLSEKLELFRDRLRSGSFPVAERTEDGRDPCFFCGYGSICGRAGEEGNGEAE